MNPMQLTPDAAGNVVLRGVHHADLTNLDSIIAEGLRPAGPDEGAHAWGQGVYACTPDSALTFPWRGVEIGIEAVVPAEKLVVVTEGNAHEMVRRYLTWGVVNPAYAVVVTVPDECGPLSNDIAGQFRVPPETVRILWYRVKATGEYVEFTREGA